MASGSVHAALIAYEGFDYPDGTAVVGANGGSGFTEPYQLNGSGAGSVSTVLAGSLTYTDALGNMLVTSGNKGFFAGNTTGNQTAQPSRFINTLRTNGTSWFSFVGIRQGITTNTIPNNPYPRGANLAFFNGTSERIAIGNGSGALTNAWAILPANTQAQLRHSTVPFQQLVLVVVRIDHLGDTTVGDNAYLFLNPTLDIEPDISTANASVIGFADHSFDRIRPFSGGFDSANGRPPAEILMDEIRIGETYADVTPYIPGIQPGKNVTWAGSAGANWDTNTANWRTNGGPLTTFVDGDFVRFDDTATGQTNVSLVGTRSPSSITVSSDLLNYHFTGSGQIGFIGGLTKSGSSVLTIENSGINTFSGPISIEAGALHVGTGGAAGSLGTGPVTNNAALLINRTGTLTMNNSISGSGSLTKQGSGTLILGGSSTFTGPTALNDGALLVNGALSGGGGLTAGIGTTLGGRGTITGPLAAGGLIYPGDVNAAGTLTVDTVTLADSATFKFDLNTNNTPGGGVNDLLQVNGDLNNVNSNSIAVNFIGYPQLDVPYRLINFSGVQLGTFNSVVSGTHFTATLDQVTPGQVNVTLSGTGGALKWRSTSSSVWDLGTTPNWLNLGNSMPDVFYAGDSVLFDDTIPGVVTSVILTTGVSAAPTSVTVNSGSNNFTFSGAGKITGPATLVKDGASTLTLSNANDFTGAVTVNGGILKAGNVTALGTAAAGTTINSGATLDVNGFNLTAEAVTVSGAGVGGRGAIINTGAEQQNALRNVTLAGDTTFGGTGRWDIRTAASLNTSPAGSAYNITKMGSNQVSLVAVTTIDPALANIDIREGTFAIQTTTTQVGDANGTITVFTGATLNFFNLSTPLNKLVRLQDGATFWNENGASTNVGNMVLEGRGIFNVASAGTAPMLLLSGEISGPGELVKIGAGPLRLTGPFSEYSGATIVSNGTLLVDGNIQGGGAVTVYGGTLGGIGSISGPVAITAGGTLAPGNASTPMETLEINNTLSLAGTNVMDVSRSGADLLNDKVIGISTLTLGGTLRLNVTGNPLLEGDVFDLFDFGTASGSFTTIVPATAGAGLRWDASQLGVNGTLVVVAAPRPVFEDVLRMGTNVVMRGTNGTPGATFYVLSSTNVALPLAQWSRVSTNMFDGGGNYAITNVVNTSIPQRFFALDAP